MRADYTSDLCCLGFVNGCKPVAALPMRQPVTDRGRRASDVDHGDRTFQLVMACFVEEVAQCDCARALSGKVCSQSGRGTSEYSHHRIQFLAAILQVGASHGEVRSAERNARCKQRSVLVVPELVRDSLTRWSE